MSHGHYNIKSNYINGIFICLKGNYKYEEINKDNRHNMFWNNNCDIIGIFTWRDNQNGFWWSLNFPLGIWRYQLCHISTKPKHHCNILSYFVSPYMSFPFRHMDTPIMSIFFIYIFVLASKLIHCILYEFVLHHIHIKYIPLGIWRYQLGHFSSYGFDIEFGQRNLLVLSFLISSYS